MSDAASIARDLTEAWNRRDWDTFRGLLHDDYTYTGGDGNTLKGPDAGLGIGQMFANAFPNGRIEVQRVHSAGDVAIVEFMGKGKHEGDLMGIAATGRDMALPVCNVITVRDGKIVSEREYMDMMTLMQQLGVAPAPATA